MLAVKLRSDALMACHGASGPPDHASALDAGRLKEAFQQVRAYGAPGAPCWSDAPYARVSTGETAVMPVHTRTVVVTGSTHTAPVDVGTGKIEPLSGDACSKGTRLDRLNLVE